MEKPKGNQYARSQDATKLDDLGINKSQSSRWQEEATVPEETFADWIGDMLAFGYKTYEELTVQMEGEYKRKLKSLQNYRYVASKIQRSLRREALPFTHHTLVTAYPAEEQRRLLRIAVSEKLSLAEFRKRQLRRPWWPG